MKVYSKHFLSNCIVLFYDGFVKIIKQQIVSITQSLLLENYMLSPKTGGMPADK